MSRLRRLVPAGILAAGAVLLALAGQQQVTPLAGPLAALPDSILDYGSRDITLDPAQQRIAGTSAYLLRVYGPDSTAFSVYVGYYESQLQGKTIHSPKNCLPGAGWEPVGVGTRRVPVPGATVVVNRYILERQAAAGPSPGAVGARALVYYWYQGRGRVAWSEYAVKWELLRDKAVHRRSEEALVRIVVPVLTGDETAERIAMATAQAVIPALDRLLPPLQPAAAAVAAR
jgi:EpsI family protein